MIWEACWSSSAEVLLAKAGVLLRRLLLEMVGVVGVVGREPFESRELEELERLKVTTPPPPTPGAGEWVDGEAEDTPGDESGWSYDSSWPSCGVGSELSLYFPIQLRLRGASGLDAGRSMAAAGEGLTRTSDGERERKQVGLGAHLG